MVGHDQILPLNTAISWLSNPASTPARGPQTPLESGSHIEEATETLTLSPALAHAGAGVYFGSSQRKEKEKNKIKDLFLSLSLSFSLPISSKCCASEHAKLTNCVYSKDH